VWEWSGETVLCCVISPPMSNSFVKRETEKGRNESDTARTDSLQPKCPVFFLLKHLPML
jgi:hypothetical protein